MLLSDLLPGVAHLQLTPQGLNTTCFVPRKDYDKGRLVRGRLQLPGGTVLLLDETAMKPGNITEHGVKNLQVGVWVSRCTKFSMMHGAKKSGVTFLGLDLVAVVGRECAAAG